MLRRGGYRCTGFMLACGAWAFLLGLGWTPSAAATTTDGGFIFSLLEDEGEAGNDTFEMRQNLPSADVVEVRGDLLEPDYTDVVANADVLDRLTLVPGEILEREETELVPGDIYVVFIDNDVGSQPLPDTIMVNLDSEGFPLVGNDDGSPVGDLTGSIIAGIVPEEGALNLRITGFPDFDFEADHGQAGDFDLYLSTGVGGFGDVDFYSIDLEPGNAFTVELFAAERMDLGIFDASGALTNFIPKQGLIDVPRMTGVVGEEGTLYFAVTAFPDATFEGVHGTFDEYTVEVTDLPEPDAHPLLAAGAAALLCLRARSRYSSPSRSFARTE